MKNSFRWIMSILATVAFVTAAQAETGTLEISVTYRERIALPPDAQVSVQLLDVSRADAASTTLAAQRVAMTSVPMSVSLPYDPTLIDSSGVYAVVADIWSGDTRLFRTAERVEVFGGEGTAVELVLTMVDETESDMPRPPSLAGIAWAVTEVETAPWPNDDPATMTIDEDMNLSIYGGCNRFSGQVDILGDRIAFPENMAGTLMACPPEIEDAERGFIATLSRVSRYVRYGGGLVMTDAEGHALLHFVEKPE